MSQSKLFDTFQIFLPQSVAATSYITSLVLENSISSLMGECVPNIRALSICIPASWLKTKLNRYTFDIMRHMLNVNIYHKDARISMPYNQIKQVLLFMSHLNWAAFFPGLRLFALGFHSFRIVLLLTIFKKCFRKPLLRFWQCILVAKNQMLVNLLSYYRFLQKVFSNAPFTHRYKRSVHIK